MMTLYTVLDETIEIGWYTLIWVIIGAFNFIVFHLIKLKNERVKLSWFSFIIPIISFLLLVFVCVNQYKELNTYRAKMMGKEVSIISGVITKYNSIKYGVKGYESFELDRRFVFKYPAKGYQYIGYDITKRNGSVLQEGMRVKIWHDKGRILRIDIPAGSRLGLGLYVPTNNPSANNFKQPIITNY